jgi:hypothetical protein
VPVATAPASGGVRREITVADEPAPTEPLPDGKALFDWNASHLSEPSGERPAAGSSFDGTAIDEEPPLVAGKTDEQILAGNGSGRTIGGAMMDDEDHSASTNVSLDDDFAPAAAPAPQIGPRPGAPSIETTMPPEPRPARKRRFAMPLAIGIVLAVLFVGIGIAGAMFGLPWLAAHRGGPMATPTPGGHATPTVAEMTATPAPTLADLSTPEPTPTQVAIVRPTPAATRAPAGTPRPASTRTPKPAGTPAVKANEQDLEFLTAKADVLAATGKLAPAKDEYQKVLAMDPSYGPAHYGLANVLDQTGDAKGACREWRTYLVLSPAGKNAGAARKKVAGCK